MARRATDVTTDPLPADLPGLEHRSIRALEDLAARFVNLGDRRKLLKGEQDALATKIIATMRKHEKDYYTRDGLEIRIELTSEKVKVKMRHEEEEDADA